MSSLSGYDKHHNSFLIPAENMKHTLLAAVPGWALKTQRLHDLGVVQFEV